MRRLPSLIAVAFFFLLTGSVRAQTASVSFLETAVFILTLQEGAPLDGQRYLLSKDSPQTDNALGSRKFSFAEQSGQCKIRLYYLEMNQRIGWRNAFGVGHEANVVEIDFSKMASVGAVDYFQSVGAAVTFAFSPGFAAGLIPKGYIPVLPQVYDSWGDMLGIKPDGDGNSFYLQYYFATKAELGVGRFWTHDLDNRLREYILSRYKQKITQQEEPLFKLLEQTEYDLTAYETYAGYGVKTYEGKLIFPIRRAKGVGEGREELERVSRARKYMRDTFGCDMAVSPRKPF